MAGQSDPHVSLFSPPEVEFMAEDELVEIVPNMRMDPLNFICGDFGPFYPQIPVKVPLWLAAALKKRGKCTIRPPQWMSIGEREDRGTFQAVPFHYIEISRLLFDHARDDIPDIYMVRSLIEDIRDVRLHKIETNLEKFSATSAVKIAHLSAMEVNVVRPFVVRALQAFYKHDNPVLLVDLDSVSDRQSHVTRQRQLPNNAQKQPLKRR
ncbi:DNA replication complex GINS protein PSF2 [Citrus sinensis]|nr:DNA replication complex GINS protein PSF2 [Citrus sinensis]